MATPDLRNVRIIDENSKEVPAIIEVAVPKQSSWKFVDYKMEKEIRKGCCTILTFENERKPISNVLLVTRNAAISKWATLLASDDRKEWYALKGRFQMGRGNMSSTQYADVLDFPLSDYKYYRVVINDSTTAPLNITSAGYESEQTYEGEYFAVDGVKMTVTDSAKGRLTWVTLDLDTTQFVDKLQFDISAPILYKRSATLYEHEGKFLRATSLPDITSEHATEIKLSTKTGQLLIRIENEDNRPLQFKAVRVWQLKRSLNAWLEAGHSYKLVFGDETFNLPNYDLGFFKDSIPDRPPVLDVAGVKLIPGVSATTSTTSFTNRNIVWVAIILVAVILGTMSVRMLKEKSNQ